MIDSAPYKEIMPIEVLDFPDRLKNYDFIFITDLFELLEVEVRWILLEELSKKIKKIAMIISKEDPCGFFSHVKNNLLNIKCQKINSMPQDFWIYILLPTIQKDDAIIQEDKKNAV